MFSYSRNCILFVVYLGYSVLYIVLMTNHVVMYCTLEMKLPIVCVMLITIACRLSLRQSSFPCSAITLWNDLPIEITVLNNYNKFVHVCKLLYLSLYLVSWSYSMLWIYFDNNAYVCNVTFFMVSIIHINLILFILPTQACF